MEAHQALTAAPAAAMTIITAAARRSSFKFAQANVAPMFTESER
jgi:hypothetical protein